MSVQVHDNTSVLFLLVSSPKRLGQFGPKEEHLKFVCISVIIPYGT